MKRELRIDLTKCNKEQLEKLRIFLNKSYVGCYTEIYEELEDFEKSECFGCNKQTCNGCKNE